MNKILFKRWLLLTGVAIASGVCLPFLKAVPVFSASKTEIQPQNSLEKPSSEAIPPSVAPPHKVATAAQPPKLVPAVLGGKPVNVLYMTRDGDTVLVRCYPTFQPVLEVRDMPGQSGVKEGKLTCKPGSS